MDLLDTRGGDYAAACAYDSKFNTQGQLKLYDTLALRDETGSEPLGLTWPFLRAPSAQNAMYSNSPVPVMLGRTR
jgi:hypothetical protein